MKCLLRIVAPVLLLLPVCASAQSKKLKVFILAGQGNMVGQARVETFDYIGDDPATAPLLKQMRGTDGIPAVADNAWISYLTGHWDGSTKGEGAGKLTAGFGARGSNPTRDSGQIGPEFTYGLTLDSAIQEPVLIIKAAWDGQTLSLGFRPPSAGPYEIGEAQIAQIKKQGRDIGTEKARLARESGRFYNFMIEHVRGVLVDPLRICPAYDPAAGYEIAGFVWFDGTNDTGDALAYPDRPDGAPDYSKHSEWLACFIRDVRMDLDAPRMPFVIGLPGVGGVNASPRILALRDAMAAAAAMPEFRGNVVAVETVSFWPDELAVIDQKYAKLKQMANMLRVKDRSGPNSDGSMDEIQQKEFLRKFEAETILQNDVTMWKRGASGAHHNYYGCAKTYALIGKAFAEANLKLLGAEP